MILNSVLSGLQLAIGFGFLTLISDAVHNLGDVGGLLVLIAAGLAIALLVTLTGWLALDALSAIGVGLAVAWSSWRLQQQGLVVALDAVPPGIDTTEVEVVLRTLPGVLDVHHVHVWAMSTSQNALTAHRVRRPGGHGELALLHEAKRRHAHLGIAHSTLQLEPPSPSPTA